MLSEVIGLVVVGRTGSGKSTVANNILGRELFQRKISPVSTTTICSAETVERYGRQIKVVDTPGIYQTSLSQYKVSNEILKSLELLNPGAHAFVYVLPVGRYSQEDIHAMKIFSELFGSDVFKYTVITFVGRTDIHDLSIQDYVRNLPKEITTFIQKCNGRYVFFHYSSGDNEAELTFLFTKITEMMRVNKPSFYSIQSFGATPIETFKRIFRKCTNALKYKMYIFGGLFICAGLLYLFRLLCFREYN